jgi:fatty-acyl-CoA synthase
VRALRSLGARTAILPRFEAVTFAESVRMSGATVVFMVPTQVQRLLALPGPRSPADLSPLRAVIVAGAPFAPAARAAFAAWLGPGKLWEFYGASETGTICVRAPHDAAADGEDGASIPGLVGKPPAGVRLELRDPAGQPVPEGELGEIFVHSPTLMTGYVGEPPLLPGQLISVGDLGRMSPAGLILVDRRHDTLISGGVNVYPAEVERVLASHPAIAHAVVCGIADPEWGDKVCALVSLRAGAAATVDELLDFARERLAPAKRPKLLRLVTDSDLPIGSSGKPLRRRARSFF